MTITRNQLMLHSQPHLRGFLNMIQNRGGSRNCRRNQHQCGRFAGQQAGKDSMLIMNDAAERWADMKLLMWQMRPSLHHSLTAIDHRALRRK